ncbi:hypothetical protein Aple_005710 [Acrocarpospora pleiomorpha]|uniref:HTH marR-type domain-containing protein n=2 Tax=Acrocarpospora pleiomorpha TaxID=90975 RepID=A0A5M3XAL6_9ACTN|nr:hypothetical protein Aple_005710 [Acrocarpospora pleiomorpha]
MTTMDATPDPAPPFDLILAGGAQLTQVARDLRTALDDDLAPFDVTSQQAALLMHASGNTPNRLAALLGTDTAGMTRLLDRLETKNLIRRQRNPADRRSIVIELTPEGRALLPKIAPSFGRANTRLLRGFTTAEITQLLAMLNRMRDNLA